MEGAHSIASKRFQELDLRLNTMSEGLMFFTFFLLFSSLCMVPVTLTLSNCSLAQVDVIIDLRHKTTRYIYVFPDPRIFTIRAFVLASRLTLLLSVFAAQSHWKCMVLLAGWARHNISCSYRLKRCTGFP